ncbi:uncharacterized protein LOC119080544 isoform X2 [Bradysia coprophila]|uniref:uncharacterized protein LOC119080544 isoform X2 n=1 Tax=Bradysia coprophila TaxID=38358 RepID=UPI00187D78C8|nr:uncharacterized protein LOC119080544 isoform X2 [Bradysia coprophila]
MAKNILLIFIGLIHFIEYIQSLPIQPNFDMTLDNEFINLGEIDTGYEEPSVYIFKRMVNQLAEQMNGMIVNEHRPQ